MPNQRSTKPPLEKMFLKPDQKIMFINLPEDLGEVFKLRPKNTIVVDNILDANFVLYFAATEEQLISDLPKISQDILPNVTFWIAYPKGKTIDTNLKRDSLHQAVKRFNLQGVSMVAINDIWAAMRFKKSF